MTSLPPGTLDRAGHARRLFARLPSSYDRMASLLSFGQDRRWRRFLVSEVFVPPGGRVLDAATGTGAVALELVRTTGASVVGLDQSEPMLLEAARRVRRAEGPGMVSLVAGRAERLPFRDGMFHAVTFTYLLRYVDDPAATLAELARVLRPRGVMAGLEFHVPPAPAWRALWSVYTRAMMPLVGRAVSGAWHEVGRFLGPSIEGFYERHPLEAQLPMWRAAGIRDVRVRAMSLGGGVVIWGRKDG